MQASSTFCVGILQELYSSLLHSKLVAGEFSRVYDFMAAWESIRESYSEKVKSFFSLCSLCRPREVPNLRG